MPDPKDEVDEPLVGKTIADNRPRYERIVVGTYGIAATFTVLGMLLALLEFENTGRYGVYAATFGLFFLAVMTELAHPLQTLRTVGGTEYGGGHYQRLRNWNRLKTNSIFLNLLTIIAGVLLAGAVMSRANVINLDLNYLAATRLTSVLGLAIAASLAYAVWVALRTPIQRAGVAGPQSAIFRIALILGVLLAASASFLTYRGIEIVGRIGGFRPIDVPFLMLAAFTAASIGIFVSRNLPTIYALFTEEREYYKGRTYMSQKKSVVLPTVVAFVLLFVVLLLLVVFQFGLAGFAADVPRNIVLLVLIAIIGLALVAALVAAVMLSRSEDRVELYKVKKSAEFRREAAILGVSAGVACLFLLAAGLLYTDVGIPGVAISQVLWLDFLTFAVLTSIGPFGFYYARKAKRIRGLEERFPDFLRDLAASRRAGLTLHNSVTIAAKGEYGDLTPEIQKMADQLSWNVPFTEALSRFGDRVNTPLIQRAVSLINEAGRSGGNVTDVLLAAATDAREIKNLENERRTTMGLYSVVTYITFFVFLVVVAILYGTFIPEILRASQAAVTGGAPDLGGVTFTAGVTLADFRAFFFLAALTQGLGNGTIAGMMESGRALTGLRHAFIMSVVTYITFTFILPA